MSPLVARLKELALPALDLVMPPSCGYCHQIVAADGALCPHCWSQLTFLAAPWCGCCGRPFENNMSGGNELCPHCLEDPPLWQQARSALNYNEVAAKLVARFKYGDQTLLLHTFLPWISRAAADLLTETDLIVPVPLHRWRLVRRQYNQAALLALAVARQFDKTPALQALTRIRATTPQVKLHRSERLKNLRGAFTASHIVKDKRVLLVDDVMTTGATLKEATSALLEAGAAVVRVLTLARVLKAEDWI
jgi:ComF family protein